MCVNCGNNCDCTKSSELKYTSQIQYDGETIEMPNTGITIEECDTLNDVIKKLADAIETINTP